jgi:tetratricopeptide (TPR) repeat protein
VTLLLWVIAQEAGLTVQLIWLDPQAPTLDRWPCVALRFPTDQGALALDPRTGDLLQASEQTPYGPELLFSALSLIDAREALSRDDLPSALRALDRAQRLTPDLWTVHALRAQSALSLPNATDALSTARASLDALAASSSTHPLAWYTTALAAATTPAGLDLNTLTPHLQALVESNPAEARLAVTLGDHLRDLHQYSAAWDAYDLALSRQPSIPGAHTGLAWLYALSDPARAREHLRAELSPKPPPRPPLPRPRLPPRLPRRPRRRPRDRLPWPALLPKPRPLHPAPRLHPPTRPTAHPPLRSSPQAPRGSSAHEGSQVARVARPDGRVIGTRASGH